jgi:hypothetical protein
MWRSFPYSRRSFVQNMMFIGMTIPVTLALFVLVGADILYLAVIIVLEVIALAVLGISPLLTTHELADGVLILRQGWYFRAEVPIADIRSVERIDRGPARTGVFFRVLSATLFVTSRRNDLIELRLRGKRSFRWALGKKADRVVFDVEDTGVMLQALKKDDSFAPVNT